MTKTQDDTSNQILSFEEILKQKIVDWNWAEYAMQLQKTLAETREELALLQE